MSECCMGDYCMKVVAHLPPEGIFKIPLVECALDEVIPEYELMAMASADTEVLIIEFCGEYEQAVRKALAMVYGEAVEEREL